MSSRGLLLAGMLAAFALWLGSRTRSPLPKSLPKLLVPLKYPAEQRAIRWSGDFLRSMGALESAPRAEQEALLAHNITRALVERLGEGILELSVLIIGGVIHLEGRVTSTGHRAVAEELARQVSGARVVADDLQVEKG